MAVLEGAHARDLSYFTLVGRLDQFLLGMALARSMRDHARWWRPWILPAATVAIVAALTIFHRLGGWPVESRWKILWPPIEGAVWASFIGGYLTVADRLPGLVSRALAAVGTVSYSIYLLHFLVIAQLDRPSLGLAADRQRLFDALLTTRMPGDADDPGGVRADLPHRRTAVPASDFRGALSRQPGPERPSEHEASSPGRSVLLAPGM